MILRILLSMVCGGLIGYEREKRLKNAGLRTHIIVAIASSLMMIVSKYGFMDIVSLDGVRLTTDGSRIASAVVQAIGFIGAGVIFIKRENVIGLTTAAGLWATVGIGLTIGCGLYSTGIIATLLILAVQAILHSFHSKSHSQNAGTVKCNITKHNIDYAQFEAYLTSIGISIRDLQMERQDNGEVVISADILFHPGMMLTETMEQLYKSDILDNVSIYPVF